MYRIEVFLDDTKKIKSICENETKTHRIVELMANNGFSDSSKKGKFIYYPSHRIKKIIVKKIK